MVCFRYIIVNTLRESGTGGIDYDENNINILLTSLEKNITFCYYLFDVGIFLFCSLIAHYKFAILDTTPFIVVK